MQRTASFARLSGRLALGPFALYLLVSFVVFGRPALQVPGRQYIGEAWDPKFSIWALGWWPHAILHGENPFVTHAIWAPVGANLPWTIGSAGLALVFAPLTLIAGPFASFNVIAVLMPALSAWTAFILCRYLTRQTWPSLAGGYLFGFSSFELDHVAAGHINYTATALLPLIALVIIRYVRGELAGRGLVLRLAPMLALQLLLVQETSFSLVLALIVSVALCALVRAVTLARVRSLIGLIVVSYAIAGLLTAPYLYYLVAGFHRNAFNPLGAYNADLLNFVVPAYFTWAGGHAAANGLPNIGAAHLAESGEAYLGAPALLCVALFACREWRRRAGRFLILAFACAVIAAMGPDLHVNSHHVVVLPWKLFQSLPLFDNALPARLAVWVCLVVAIIIALWAAGTQARWLRYLLPALAIAVIAPNPTANLWETTYLIPRFFTNAKYHSCLNRGERVMPLPIHTGDGMLWEAADDYRFSITAGVNHFTPPSFLVGGDATIINGAQLGAAQTGIVRSFIRQKGVTTVIVAANEITSFDGALHPLAHGQEVGGVVLYHFTKKPPICP